MDSPSHPVPCSDVKGLLAWISGLLWRDVLVQEKGESMLDVFMRLDFCETPSREKTVARRSRSVRAWSACAVHSPPAFVESAY